jgi:hypothetical protein
MINSVRGFWPIVARAGGYETTMEMRGQHTHNPTGDTNLNLICFLLKINLKITRSILDAD